MSARIKETMAQARALLRGDHPTLSDEVIEQLAGFRRERVNAAPITELVPPMPDLPAAKPRVHSQGKRSR